MGNQISFVSGSMFGLVELVVDYNIRHVEQLEWHVEQLEWHI